MRRIILGWRCFYSSVLFHCLINYTWLFFIWAAIIAYAQVYVGVHYPLDVIAGAMIGLAVGKLNGMIFKKFQDA